LVSLINDIIIIIIKLFENMNIQQMSYIVHQDENSTMGQTASESSAFPSGAPQKKPRASRAKKAEPSEGDAKKAELSEPKPTAKPRASRAKKGGATHPDTKHPEADGNIKLADSFPGEAKLPDAKHEDAKHPEAVLAVKKPRGRPPVDKWATVEARIRGGEFEDDSKAKLAIYISRVLAEDKTFRPRMKDLMSELGHVDLLSVFALR